MIRVLLEAEEVEVPRWVVDLASFRRWTDEEDFPETGHVSYLQGDVWIDMSKEQLFTHNQVKSEINRVLGSLVKTRRVGRYFMDGAYVSNPDAEVSNQPDGIFLSTASLKEGRVRIVAGRAEGHVELEGSPDMVLEVVSRSSLEKDTVILRQAYARAEIQEYWLVDARQPPLQFDLLRLGRRGFVGSRKQASWVYSKVFQSWFRLTQRTGADGFPEYTLDVRSERS